MNDQLFRSQFAAVKNTLNQLFPLLDQAEKKFASARNWGFVDIFGGGLITDLIKHSHLNAASNIMNRINYLLQTLQSQLKSLVLPGDFSMNTGTFASFADFVFDGVLADVYMQSKIMTSLDQVRELKRRLITVDDKLNEIAAKVNS